MYFDFDLSFARVCDAGNINTDTDFKGIIERATSFLENVKGMPITIGGEHTVSYACIQDLKDVCYLTFDAHFDLRDEFDKNRFNHACTVRRIYEKYEEGNIERIVQIGIRSGTPEERSFARKSGIDVYYAWDVLESGVGWISKRLEEYDRIYISLDMDAFDPAFAPGVSTPEPFGIHPIHFLRLLDDISDRIVGFDIVEVVPDSEKITQTLGAKIIAEVIAATSI
jgi:agmatinase